MENQLFCFSGLLPNGLIHVALAIAHLAEVLGNLIGDSIDLTFYPVNALERHGIGKDIVEEKICKAHTAADVGGELYIGVHIPQLLGEPLEQAA